MYFTFLWIFVQVERVREAVWDSGWVGSALPFQRCLIFVITSTNKTFQITAGKFVPVSNKTMMNVRIKGLFKKYPTWFFPLKLMRHGRCAVIGRWKVPSCAYMDFFPPAGSISRGQPTCEWWCIRSARRIVIFCENVISPFQLRFKVGDQQIIARSHVRRVGCLLNHRNVVFGQEILNQLQQEFRGHSPQEQIIGRNGMYRTSAYSHRLRKFSDGDMTVLHDQSQHLVNELIISACWEPTKMRIVLHRRAAIFESVVPLLNLCDAHAIIAKKNPLNLLNGFHLAISKLLAKFEANPLLESFRHFRRMRRALYIHSHSHAGCTRLMLSAGGKKSRYVHEGILHRSTTAHLRASLVSAEKKIMSHTFWTALVYCKISSYLHNGLFKGVYMLLSLTFRNRASYI